MFCHQCGKELRENSRFCSNCGTPVREIEQAAVSVQAVTPDEQTTTVPALSEMPVSSEEAASVPPADLILKKGKVIVSGRELHLNGKHYTRMKGKKKFKKQKEAFTLPFDTILGTAMEHKKYGGRILLSLLLLVCFAAGALFSARYGYYTFRELNTPYQDKELASLENVINQIDNGGAEQLIRYRNSREEKSADADALTAKLAELEAQQTQEILASVYTNEKFDLDTFFNSKLFAQAYQEYLQDLLDAFKEDELLNSWLYSYYQTAKAYNGNYFLDTDLWIYDSDGEDIFSSDLDSVSGLMSQHYDLDLYEHILYTGHIYITAADFMNRVLSLPRYTVDGAVFAKAFGSAPDPSAMAVPGWSRSHYEEFWLYGADYYNVDTPVWLDYGLNAENFDLDWNTLVDEAGYYAAYQKFMDKIAPGLPRYDIVTYRADDEAYGGLAYNLKGTEASISDIVVAYAENHPEFIDELKEQGIFTEDLTTTVDEDIAEAKSQLEKLEAAISELENQEKELERILANADTYRSDYELLLTDIEQHTRELTYRLIFFGGTALLCVIAALICLCKFFGFLKRPRNLFIISRPDMDYAFNAKRCSKEDIAALQNRLPRQANAQTATENP